MSSPSDAENIDYGARGTKRFDVWRSGSDFFNYTELAGNFDLLDGVIGRPPDNSQWPPYFGLNGGIWREIQNVIGLLDVRETPIGMLAYWFRPSVAVPLTYITDKGWALCDGSEVTDHDYPGFVGSFYTPDLRNRFIVGADITRPVGIAGTATQSPGEMTMSGPNNVGESGSHSSSHTHTMGNHTHTVANHTHPIATHSHVVPEHRHILGGETLGPVQGSEQTNDGSGTAHNVSFYRHSHYLPARTGNVVDGSFSTGTGGPSSTGSAGGQTTSASGAGSTSSTSLDNRPRHVGLLPIIKVRNP